MICDCALKETINLRETYFLRQFALRQCACFAWFSLATFLLYFLVGSTKSCELLQVHYKQEQYHLDRNYGRYALSSKSGGLRSNSIT